MELKQKKKELTIKVLSLLVSEVGELEEFHIVIEDILTQAKKGAME